MELRCELNIREYRLLRWCQPHQMRNIIPQSTELVIESYLALIDLSRRDKCLSELRRRYVPGTSSFGTVVGECISCSRL